MFSDDLDLGTTGFALHEQIGDPTLADGILRRLVHNAHPIEMRGDGQSVLVGMFDMVDDEDIGRGGRPNEFKPQLFLQGFKKARSRSRSLIGRSRDVAFGGPFEAEVKGSS